MAMTEHKPRKKKLYVNGILVGEVDATGEFQKDMAVAQDFLRRRGLNKEVTKVQAMFRQALSFATTSAYLYQRDLLKTPRKGLSIAPFVVNSAFSIELYLKTLHELQGVTARGHALLELYDTLSDVARDTVFRFALEHAPEYKVKLNTREEFRSFVAEMNNAFVEWRYCYETGHANRIDIQPTILVMKALHEACKESGAT